MKRLTKVIACAALVLSFACAGCATTLSPRESELWDMTVSRYLSDKLWLEDEAYDAGHHLMVPMHAAFELGDEARIAEFDEHINRFINIYELEEQTDRQTDRSFKAVLISSTITIFSQSM